MNKVFVVLYVPLIETQYEMFIPINKKVYKIVNLLVKSVNEMSGGHYPLNEDAVIYNKQKGKVYDMNTTVKNTDIRNGTEIILM